MSNENKIAAASILKLDKLKSFKMWPKFLNIRLFYSSLDTANISLLSEVTLIKTDIDRLVPEYYWSPSIITC